MVALTGPAGGGFLLDTNGLHRAQLAADGGGGGGGPRTAVLLEWRARSRVTYDLGAIYL